MTELATGETTLRVLPLAPVTALAPVVLGSPPGAAPDAGDVDVDHLGLATARARTSWPSRVITLIAVVVPAAAVVAVAASLWGIAFTWLDLGLFVALYVLTGLGITVGYHRLFTHRSFETATALRLVFAVLGAMTLQGPLTQWVTDHRKHHARSDQEGDPHSPHLGGDGVVASVRGLWHSHVGWLFSTKGMERGALYGRDLYEDPMIRWVDRLYLVWVALSVMLPFALGWLIGGTLARGVEAMIWAGLVRIFAFEHATFAVNSICHTFGRRPYDARDKSRNNWFVAMLTFGEGWHNNHHAFPRSARHGLERLQLDVSWLVIWGLERLRLARAVRVPTVAQRGRVLRRAVS